MSTVKEALTNALAASISNSSDPDAPVLREGTSEALKGLKLERINKSVPSIDAVRDSLREIRADDPPEIRAAYVSVLASIKAVNDS